jgi:hypothetical protein
MDNALVGTVGKMLHAGPAIGGTEAGKGKNDNVLEIHCVLFDGVF